ncbi:MAG: DedA family protein [Planctomycetota bacterium]|nr:DedA family protein [Planctomycetota bacterium]
MLHDLIVTWFNWVRDFGYVGVVLLMAAESSILPVPSEIVIPPAAYWASQGKMNIVGVVVAGTIGSLIGALIMYYVSRKFGRPFLLRHGKWFFVSPEKLERAERFLARYETGGVFFARLLPVVRHLIGIPAGIVRMKVVPYAIATTLGSAIWCTILAWFGQEILGSEPKLLEDPNAMMQALKAKSLPIIGSVLALLALYILVVKLTDKKQPTD